MHVIFKSFHAHMHMHMHVNKARQNVLLHMLFKDAAGCGELMDQSNLEHLINCNQDVSAHLHEAISFV